MPIRFRLGYWCLIAAVSLASLSPVLAQAPDAPNHPPAPPVITTPVSDQISPEDVHMELIDAFQDPDGDAHQATDWQILLDDGPTVVWQALASPVLLHAHLGDGAFVGPLAGKQRLEAVETYLFRVRFQDSRGAWSDWSQSTFVTSDQLLSPLRQVQGLLLQPAPTWLTDGQQPLSLPAGAQLQLVAADTTLLTLQAGDQGLVAVAGERRAAPAPLRILLSASPSTDLRLPSSRLALVTDAATRLTLFLPALHLAPGQTRTLWVTETGATFHDLADGSGPDREHLARDVAIPWAVAPGYQVEAVNTTLQLPTSLAFVTDPGTAPNAPRVYVAELHRGISVITNDGQRHTFAGNLLDFVPEAQFPGAGEIGLVGVCLPPGQRDVYATLVYVDHHGTKRNMVMRLRTDDGLHVTGREDVLVIGQGEGITAASHQIQQCSFGPDGKLYVSIGDGLRPKSSQKNDSFLGKVIRLNPDGSAPPDNPFYDPAAPTAPRSYLWTLGHRNAFGMTWRAADGRLYLSENGPDIDRLVRVTPGQNYGWDGTNQSMRTGAHYLWPTPRWSPVGLAFADGAAATALGPAKTGHLFVGSAGPVYAPGQQMRGKAIQEFVLAPDGALTAEPTVFARYSGEGRGSIVDVKLQPDGLYFTSLYAEDSHDGPVVPGGGLWRIRATDQVDSPAPVGPQPQPGTVVPLSAQAPPAVIAFPETGMTLGNGFKYYWEQHGGLAQFGAPLTNEFQEISPTDGVQRTVQYFERARFEYHPEHQGTPYETELGLLGREVAAQPSAAEPFRPLDPAAPRPDDARVFPETGHALSGLFRQHWEATGGLAIYGLPLSQPFLEAPLPGSEPRLVQYFERARLEVVPGHGPVGDTIRLAPLGILRLAP